MSHQKIIFFLLLGLEVTQKQEKSISDKLNLLRESIRDELLVAKPSLIDHHKLANGALPELHGEWLFQSQEYYRLTKKHPGYSSDYWYRQINWYEKALKIISQHNPNLFYYLDSRAPEEKTPENVSRNFPDVDEDFANRVWDILSNKYLINFPAFMIYLGLIGSSQKLILADNYDQCKGFSDEDLYRYLRQEGIALNVSTPEFISSEDNVLIQAADLVAYIICITLNSKMTGHITPKTIIATRLYQKWIRKKLIPILPNERVEGHSMPVSWALAMDTYAKHDSDFRRQWLIDRQDNMHSAAVHAKRFGLANVPDPFEGIYIPRVARLLDSLATNEPEPLHLRARPRLPRL